MGPIEEFYARREARLNAQANGHIEWPQTDWHDVFTSDFQMEWLVDGLWPTGKHLHMFASHKTGKSLISLAIAIGLAIGRDPFTGAAIPERDVTYLDFEMSMVDLQERAMDMGYTESDADRFNARLHYRHFPAVGYLDTPEGGASLMRMVAQDHSEAVIIDTLARVVKGEENSNDTYKNFYNYTGKLLKAAGVAMLRLDHEGHQKGHSRGASSKADDVDLVYQLKRTDSGLELVRQLSRVSYVRASMALEERADPLRWETTGEAWPQGTKERANDMDALDLPLDVSQRKARAALVEAGKTPGNNQAIAAAIRFRQSFMKWP